MRYLLQSLAIILFLLITNATCQSKDIVFPHDWRKPLDKETHQEWRIRDINKYLIIKVDFNGDGVVDQANLLINNNNNEIGFFAFVSQKDGTFKTFFLDKKGDINYIKVLGITVVHPGRYKTACGKGFIDCPEGESEEIFLLHDAINYFKEGSAQMYFYWDNSTQSFKSVGIDD